MLFQPNLCSLASHFLNQYILAFFVEKTLNCHNSEPVRAFDLITMLRARPKNQLLSGSLVLEDHLPQNWWDYASKMVIGQP